MKKTDFSIFSSCYDFLGSLFFFGALHRSQLKLVDKILPCSNVLIIGGGTGRFLIDFLLEKKTEKIVYIDISPGMIRRAETKVKTVGLEKSVEFICGSVDDVPDLEFDLICTHYFLDCFEGAELHKTFQQLEQKLSRGAQWHFTDFNLDKDSPLFHKKLVGFLYWFFRVTCGLKVKGLANFKDFFNAEGLELEEEYYFRRSLLRTAIYRKL